MKTKPAAISALFRALAATTAIGITTVVAATALAALSPGERDYAADWAAQIAAAINDARIDLGEASIEENKAAILEAISKTGTPLGNDDPELLSAALMMAAVILDLPPNSNFVTAFRAVQETVLADAIVHTVQEAGGGAASEEAIATAVADTISMAGVPASLAQASLATASGRLASANIASPALTTALASVQTAVETAQTIQSTTNTGSAQAQVQIAGSSTVVNVYVRGA